MKLVPFVYKFAVQLDFVQLDPLQLVIEQFELLHDELFPQLILQRVIVQLRPLQFYLVQLLEQFFEQLVEQF